MNKAIKWIGGGIATAVLIGFGTKIFKTKNTGDKLVVKITNPRIHKLGNPITGEGIEIAMDVKLSNPTKDSIKLTQPFIKVFHDDNLLTSTDANNKIITVPALSNANTDPIKFTLKYTQLISLLTEMNIKFPEGTDTLVEKATYLKNNASEVIKKLALSIEYSTYANGIYYSKTVGF